MISMLEWFLSFLIVPEHMWGLQVSLKKYLNALFQIVVKIKKYFIESSYVGGERGWSFDRGQFPPGKFPSDEDYVPESTLVTQHSSSCGALHAIGLPSASSQPASGWE